MRLIQITKEDSGETIAGRVVLAHRFFSKLKGLMGRKSLQDVDGLLLTRTKQIHTFWMFLPIDIVYLKQMGDNEYIVHRIVFTMRPWRVGRYDKEVTDVLELKAGILNEKNIKPGTILKIVR